MKIDTSSWDKVTLGDIAQSLTIATKDPLSEGLERYVGLEHIEPGNVHIKSWGKVTDGTTFTRVFRKGQVLFGKRRAYQKKAAVAEFDGICSGDILVCEAIKGAVLPELLPFIVQSDRFFEHAIKTSAGSLSPRTKFKDLAKFTFKLPANPADQKRIAELLWSVDVAKEQWTNCFYLLKQYKKCFMRDLINSREKKVKLKDLFDVNWGNTSITKKSYKETGFDAFSASGLDGKLDFFEHDGPGIVLSAIGAYCGKCFRADGKWTAIKNTITIKPLVQLDIDTYFEILNNYEFWPIDGGAQPFIGIGKSREMLIPLIDTKSQSGLFIKQIQHQSFFLSEYLNKIQDLNKQIINQIFR